MIQRINILLTLVEKFIKKNKKYIGYIFLFFAILSLSLFWVKNGQKESGEKAILVLWIILWLPIFSRVFGLRIAQALMPLRKELGILMGTLAVVHASIYLAPSPVFIFSPYFWLDDNTGIRYLAFGFFALLLTLPLLLTSNLWAMKKMGRSWKTLHKSIYIIVILVVIHIVLQKYTREFDIMPVLILVFYFIGKILEWRNIVLYTKIPKLSE